MRASSPHKTVFYTIIAGYATVIFNPRRNGSLYEQSNGMLEQGAIARQTIKPGYIYNNKQAQKPHSD